MILLKPKPINPHLVGFFFISKTFTEPLLTDMQREHSHRMDLEKLPGHRHRPHGSWTAALIWDSPPQPGRWVPHGAQPPATQGWALCGRKDGARVWEDPPRASDHLHVNSQTKAPRPAPRLRPWSGRPLSPWSLGAAGLPAGIWQTRLEGFVTLFRVLSLGKYITGFSNYPRTTRWER